jgi:hypothetical protein
MFGSFRILEDRYMVETVEDWSKVRSPARAVRRLKVGKRRRGIPVKEVPMQSYVRQGNTLIMHPELADRLRQAVQERIP